MPKLEIGKYQNPRGDRTKKSIDEYVRGMGKKRTFQYKKNDRGKIIKIPMLTGGQAKLDKNKNNRIDAEDFKMLRAGKKKGGMFKGYSKPFQTAAGPGSKGTSTIVAVKPGAKIKGQRKKFKSMDEMRKAKGFKPGESAADFNKRMDLKKGALRAAKATRIGKIVLPIAVSGVGAIQYLKSKMKKKDKKMGGGMMKKYNKGGGADTGKVGEMKSKLSVLSNKLRRQGKRLTKRDGEKAGDIAGSIVTYNFPKKNLKYNRGGMYLTDEKIKKVFPQTDAKRRANISQLVGGDKVSPMKKERFTAGQRARRRDMLKNIGKKIAKTTPMGLGIKAGEVAKKIKEKMSKKMGGGMMKKPMGYAIGGPTYSKELYKKLRQESVGVGKPTSKNTPVSKRSAVAPSKKKEIKTLKQKLNSASIEAFIESTKDKVNPLKGDRVAGRGERRMITEPGKGTYLSTRGTTGRNWRAGKDRIDEFVTSGDAEKTYKRTGRLFTNYSGKMMSGGMMNKPMGYKSGKSIKVKCKLGRNKPTKMY